MSLRDTQIVISRQSVLLVTGVGVGLLTMAYVLGVQVGKQSAALRRPQTPSVEEELKTLPEPLLDQLKIFESGENAAPEPKAKLEPAAVEAPHGEPPKVEAKPSEVKPAPKHEAKPAPSTPAAEAKASAPDGRWNLQLVATPDAKEAERVAAKAKAAGYLTATVKEGRFHKVRVARPLGRSDADKAVEKLKEKGLKPYVTKAD